MMKQHAVVLGGSMSGLGTARALSNHFERVTVIERDTLSTVVESDSRKGVPQGNHGHVLLVSGYRVLDDYFPGMMSELVAAGATLGDATGDFLLYQFGNYKLRADTGTKMIVMSRPLLEAKVRQHVRARSSITILDNHDVIEPVCDPTTQRVTAVTIKDRATDTTRTLDADLVVDVTGRGSQSPKWLKSWGFDDVAETNVKVDVGYASALFERRPGDIHGAMGMLGTGTPPASKRGGAAFAVENDRWMVTLGGWLRDYPPTDLIGFREFARSLPCKEVGDLIKDREPLTEIVQYRFPANRHRHYEKLTRFPEGYLVLGDAICSFNPLYGQGMSVGLTEAKALDVLLSDGGDRLAARFFKRTSEIIVNPWTIAVGEDLRFPEVEAPRPAGSAVLNRYLERVHRAATRDLSVVRAFVAVQHLLAPPTALLTPSIVLRVLLGGFGPSNPSHETKHRPS